MKSVMAGNVETGYHWLSSSSSSAMGENKDICPVKNAIAVRADTMVNVTATYRRFSVMFLTLKAFCTYHSILVPPFDVLVSVPSSRPYQHEHANDHADDTAYHKSHRELPCIDLQFWRPELAIFIATVPAQ